MRLYWFRGRANTAISARKSLNCGGKWEAQPPFSALSGRAWKSTVNSQQSTVNSQQSTVNSQQSTSTDGATGIDINYLSRHFCE
ncbi:hypothetical protein [Microcoleus sp. AR_TQ3_B6]|uniref:hypothetical protein n=1 Tax=Microcoleus sp. AR_TQ3_B6 TaxID=3055284 RepID=UPI002FD7114F